MSIEQNKAVVRRFVERGLEGEVPNLDELLAPDYVNHLAPGGREGLKKSFGSLSSAFPDFKIQGTVQQMIAEGDYVAAYVKFHYSNAGKEETLEQWAEFRLANGKIVEDWPPGGEDEVWEKVGVTLPTGPG